MASNYDRRSSSSASRPSRGAVRDFDDIDRRPPARRTSDPRKGRFYKRMRLLVIAVVVTTLALIGYAVVVYSPLFEIRRITATPTAHVTSETISALAAVPAASTLFNVDEKGVTERLAENPWIASATLARSFPNELVIEVQERTAGAVVMLANGSEAWLIATDGCWLEPVELVPATADNGAASPADQARAAAAAQGLVYVEDVSALVQPVAGEQCEDAAISGVMDYLAAFTDALRGQIAWAKAPSREGISVVLSSGIEVSLGVPSDIELKEQAALALLDQFAGQITYINVRVPTKATWRGLDAAQAGDLTGATAPDQVVPELPDEDQLAAEAEAQKEEQEALDALVGGDEGGPGGNMDEGGYYSDDGTWIYAYHDADGNWINGYYDEDGEWVRIS